MCLSNVYRNSVDDANLLAKNVADIKIVDDHIYFTDIMGIRTVFDGQLEKIDLMDNYIIVKE
ncbi:MAG: CooT family nickel-binding protein [Mogibacterium sp.]|nr:CooT family nickel-binding protein [Mogibacterium sp.]